MNTFPEFEINDFFDFVDGFENITEYLRGLSSEKEMEEYLDQISASSYEFLKKHGKPELEQIAVYYTDKFYRIFNRLDFVDNISFSYLKAVSRVFCLFLKEENIALTYLVDNQIPEGRLDGLRYFFGSMGFVILSPELAAIELGKADGFQPDEIIQKRIQQYKNEAKMLAFKMFDQAVLEGRHIFFFSWSCGLEDYQSLGKRLEGIERLGIFRNQLPEDGTNIQVFQSSKGKFEIKASH